MNRVPIDFVAATPPSNANGAASAEPWEIGPPPGFAEEAAQPVSRSITTVGVDEIFAPLPPVPWVVEALKLAPGGCCASAGYGYVGKTVIAQSIATSCASGRPVFGLYRASTCRVLHLDYEQGRRVTFDRYQRLARAMGVDPREIGDALRVAVLPSIYLDSEGAEDIYARAMDGFGLVIVDSLRAATPGADENSSEIRRHIDALTRAGEKTGALPLFLVHARKPSENDKGGAKMSIRGSSAIFDACAGVFVLEAQKGEPIRVHHEKERHTGTTIPDFGIRIEDVEIDGDPRAGLRVVHMETEQLSASASRSDSKFAKLKASIIEIVKDAPGTLTSRNAICARVTGGGKDAKLEAIRELVSEGRLRQPQGEDGGFYVAV